MVTLELQAKDLIQIIKQLENNTASALMHHKIQLINTQQNLIQQIHIDRLKHD